MKNFRRRLRLGHIAAGAVVGLILQTPEQAIAAEPPTRIINPGGFTGAVVKVSVGYDYSVGRYGGAQTTRVIAFPLTAKYVTGPFTFRLSAPFLRLEGPGSLITTSEGGGATGAPVTSIDVSGKSGGSGGGGSGGGGSGGGGSGGGGSGGGGSGGGGSGGGGSGGGGSGGGGSGGGGSGTGGAVVVPGAASRIDSGIGDLVAALTYSWDVNQRGLVVDFTGKLKLPTASATKRLGTGRTDFTLAVDVAQDVQNLSFYAGVRRRFAGRSAAFPVRDTWGGNVGASVTVRRGLAFALDYQYQQSPFGGLAPSHEFTASSTVDITSRLKIQVYGGTGLNRNSVDATGGLEFLWRFGGS